MKIKTIATSIFISLLIISCSDDDDVPEIVNEEEVITTLNLTLTPADGGATVELSSRDLDGDGPNPPEITVENLTANTVYNAVVEVLNEIEGEDITEEVAEEDDEHQFFYQAVGDVSFTLEYNDADDDNNPLGIATTITTGAPGSGNMVVVLRHLLDKFAEGVADGDITNAGGDTDVEVSFPIVIE